MVSITKEMKETLEEERKRRLLDSIPETIRTILSEYLSNRGKPPDISEVVKTAAKEYVGRKK